MWPNYDTFCSYNTESRKALSAVMTCFAPSHTMPVITQDGVIMMRWGLIPKWAKDDKISYKMINARSESVEMKKKKYVYSHCTQAKGKHDTKYILESVMMTLQLKKVFKSTKYHSVIMKL